ncbi:glycosyltransferase family 87 protein [Larkinella knui]
MAFSLLVYSFLMWQRKSASAQGDMKVYHSIATQLSEGKIPYRDFTVEYPPLALVPLVMPHLVSLETDLDYRTYAFLYTLDSLLLMLAFAVVLLQVARRWPNALSRWQLLSVYLLFIILSRDFLLWRYDLFPALLTLLAFSAVLLGQPLRAGIWLGLAITAKLYPVILVPVMLVYYVVGRQYRASLALLAGTGLSILLVVVPMMILSDNRVFSFLTYHQLRGLQIESSAAGLLMMVHLPDLTQVSTEFNYGAFHLLAAGVDPVLKVLPWLFLAIFGGLLALFAFRLQRDYRRSGAVSAESLLVCLLATLLIFIITNKVFSPQYLIWLLPFVLFLRVQQIAVVGVIFLLTNLVYPVFYPRLVDPTVFGVLLLNGRNLLVIGLLVQLLKKAGWIRRGPF